VESLLQAIQSSKPHIIIPCDDLAVQDLQRLYAQAEKQGMAELAALIELSLGSHDSFPIVTSRFDLLRIAAEGGVLTPQTHVISGTEDIRSNCNMPFPWVLKADGTWGGSGVRVAHDRKEAEKQFLELSSNKGLFSTLKQLLTNRTRSSIISSWKRRAVPSVVAQSFIEGRPANCAVVCWKGQVLAGIGVEVISSHGAKGPAIVVRPVESAEMMQAAEIIAARLNLSGFFGLDFMIESVSNLTYLIEMNPRCTPLSHLQLGERKDLIGALIAELQGEVQRKLPPVTASEVIAYFPQAASCKSRFLETGFNDVPDDGPALIEALLYPWSERGVLGRVLDGIRRIFKEEAVVTEHIFAEALRNREVESGHLASVKSVLGKISNADSIASVR
jgi:predicted ATP-grasp superfamily ATP-dependent carboligase